MKNSDFSSPWEEARHQKTELVMSFEKDSIQFDWKIVDDNLLLSQNNSEEYSAVNSDRVEIFFSIDSVLSHYYTLEIDLSGRIFDAQCQFYRKVDINWDWPDMIHVRTWKERNIYKLSFAVSRKTLMDLKILQNESVYLGVFRADYDLQGKSSWITWANPYTERPDFHTPKAFRKINVKVGH